MRQEIQYKEYKAEQSCVIVKIILKICESKVSLRLECFLADRGKTPLLWGQKELEMYNSCKSRLWAVKTDAG